MPLAGSYRYSFAAHAWRASYLGRLLCFLGLCLFPSLGVADISIPGRWGYNVTESFQNGGFLVVNGGSSPVTVSFLNGSGVHSSSPSMSVFWWGFTGSTYSLTLNTGPASAPVIPANSTRFVSFYCAVSVPGSGNGSNNNAGAHDIDVAINIKENGGTTVAKIIPRFGTILVAQVSQPGARAIVGSGGNLVGAGIPLASPQSGSTQADTFSFGTITVGVPVSGSITCKNFTGNFDLRIKIDGSTVNTTQHRDPDQMAVCPDIVWNTTTPGIYDGKAWEVVVNGTVVSHGTVTLTGGSFAIVVNALIPPEDWVDYTKLQFAPDEDTEVPKPMDQISLGPGNDPDHVRPAPGPIPGTDPKNDNTVDSDGAGAGVGLSVRDQYRATRAAIEDALRTPDGARFDFDDWNGTDVAHSDGAARDAGNAFGQGMAAMGNAGTGGAGFSIPGIDGADPLSVTVAGIPIILPVPVAIASTVRLFLLGLLCIFVWMRAMQIVRNAFAG